ncbi:serine hydrolase domain-containing protein [Fodinibius sp. AD559]|uniref:serine hydrolase domain-containing protein n=1 Tax=Fodinibius sp. AD559 TaxID=3424179 RepID=UPI004046F80E
MSKRCWISVALLLLVFCLSSGDMLAQQKQDHSIVADIDSLQTTVDSLLQENNIPGAGIALVHKDSVIWSGGVGYADYEDKKPVTADHLFRVGSISKTFVAMGIMQLVQDGKLSLDDEVQELVPEVEIKNRWHETDPVRVKHLLEHTAGFDDMHFSEFYNTRHDPNISLEKALSINPKSREVRWRPGTRYSYSNPGYAVAGYIIEKVTGQSYEDYLREHILNPLEMNRSSFAYSDSVKEALATGYKGEYEPVEYQHIYLRPAGMLHSSPTDMAKFVQLLLNNGSLNGQEIIAEILVERMETTETTLAAKHGFSRGYGLGITNSEMAGYPNLNHGGGIDGFVSQYMYFPEYDLGYVLLLNSSSGFGDIREKVTRFLLDNVKKPEPQSTVELSEKQLDKYEGYYAYRSPRNQLFMPLHVLLDGVTLEVSDDTLCTKGFMESTKSLLPVSENKFRSKDKIMASTFFMGTEEYGQVMQHDSNFYVKTGSWKKYVYRGAFFGGLGILVTLLLFSLFWIPFEGYRKYSSNHTPFSYQALFWWPFAALCSIGLLVLGASQLELLTIGERTFAAMLITAATYLFGVSSVGALWTSLRSWQKEIHPAIKIYFSIISVTLIGFTLFFFYWDWMGLRLWAY